jgi:hypothetical protein
MRRLKALQTVLRARIRIRSFVRMRSTVLSRVVALLDETTTRTLGSGSAAVEDAGEEAAVGGTGGADFAAAVEEAEEGAQGGDAGGHDCEAEFEAAWGLDWRGVGTEAGGCTYLPQIVKGIAES